MKILKFLKSLFTCHNRAEDAIQKSQELEELDNGMETESDIQKWIERTMAEKLEVLAQCRQMAESGCSPEDISQKLFESILADPDSTPAMRLNCYAAMYEQKGELEKAYHAYLSEAEKGSARAMNYIGNLYFHALYDAQSDGGAGAIRAALQNRGGIMFPWDMQEQRIPNYAKAREWYLRAAEKGFVPAMMSAGVLLHEGQGGPKDDVRAKELLTRAAQMKHEGAIAALRDYYGIEPDITYSMEQYRQMLRDFEDCMENLNGKSASLLYGKLLLGSPIQLYKLGYVLAKGRYSTNREIRKRYEFFQFAKKPERGFYMPVEHVRGNYQSTFVIHLDAFDDENPVISYTLDGSGYRAPDPVKWLVHEENRTYTGEEFSWVKETRYANILRVDRNYPDGLRAMEENKRLFIERDDEFRAGHIKLLANFKDQNVAIFYDCPEKDFAIEICDCTNEFVPIFRYVG